MMKFRNDKGFTLIEILLVVAIMGVMLAVIVPRAWRANIDAKYGLVRQNCSELAAFGQEWMEQQLLAQEEAISTATANDHLLTLAGTSAYGTAATGTWIARQNSSNWNNDGAPISVIGRYMNGDDTVNTVPEACVEDIIPPEKIPRNPFNQVSVFVESNDPVDTTNVVVGAINCAVIEDDVGGAGNNVWYYYAFLFQGTDSTTVAYPKATTYHAGQDRTLEGLRNGIFFARIRP